MRGQVERIEDAAAESRDAEVDPRDVAELLARLLDKSLILVEETPDGSRYRLPELVREYGREVVYNRREGEAIRRRHRDYFLGLALEAERNLSGHEQPRWLARLEVEHDNLRAALDYSFNDPDDLDHLAAQACGGIWRFWYYHAYLAEGRRWMERALAEPGLPPALRAKVLNGAGAIAREAGDYEAARVYHEESITLFRELGDEKGLAGALGNLGNLALNHKDYGAAEAFYRSSLALCRKLGDRLRAAYSLNNLGVVARHHGDMTAAWALYEEALAIHQELGNRHWEGITLSNLGALAYFEEKYDQSRKYHAASLEIRLEVGDRAGLATTLEAFGALLTVTATPEDDRRAARLYGAGQALRERIGAPLHADEQADFDRDMAVLRNRMDPEAFESFWEEGQRMPVEDAVEEAREFGQKETPPA